MSVEKNGPSENDVFAANYLQKLVPAEITGHYDSELGLWVGGKEDITASERGTHVPTGGFTSTATSAQTGPWYTIHWVHNLQTDTWSQQSESVNDSGSDTTPGDVGVDSDVDYTSDVLLTNHSWTVGPPKTVGGPPGGGGTISNSNGSTIDFC